MRPLDAVVTIISEAKTTIITDRQSTLRKGGGGGRGTIAWASTHLPHFKLEGSFLGVPLFRLCTLIFCFRPGKNEDEFESKRDVCYALSYCDLRSEQCEEACASGPKVIADWPFKCVLLKG